MPSELGDFLRASRNAASPWDLPTSGRRQVSGMRREEVAVSAGISVDYYVRLEQGRETGPSPQVLDALAHALRLSRDAQGHLYRLAGLAPQPPQLGSYPRVSAGVRRMLDEWQGTPALVLGPAYDVLAWNALGGALFGGFDRNANLVERMFLDPTARTFYEDWESAASGTVAGLRLQRGERPNDPRITEVVGRLLSISPDFNRLWSANHAQGKQFNLKVFQHPQVGRIEVEMLVLDVRDGSEQELIIYQAAPDTSAMDALSLLGSLAATSPSGTAPERMPHQNRGDAP